jgi:hypothetical protein
VCLKGKAHNVTGREQSETDAVPGGEGGGKNLCEEMRRKIDEVKYRSLYGRRMQIIEPCFSDMSYCKGMDRFSLRTKVKVNIQWLLYCMVHNIGKCIPGIAAESGRQGVRGSGFREGKDKKRTV